MLRLARFGLYCVLGGMIAAGCKKSTPAGDPALRFLPDTAEQVVRIDLVRARAWSGFAAAAKVAFAPLSGAITAVKRVCDLDLIEDAQSIVVARRGSGPTGDMTLLIAGLPDAKLRACPPKIGPAIPHLTIVPDGDRFTVNVADKGYASGAVLEGGELVIVTRGSANVAPAAWRDEVTGGSGTAPKYWDEIDLSQAIAFRAASKDRVITASAELGDPFVVRGKDVAIDGNVAQLDAARLRAIVDFLTKAEAGTGRIEPRGNTLHADFTATGKQVDNLVASALATIGSAEPATPEDDNRDPIDCAVLSDAVATYMAKTTETMAADQKAATETVIAKLVPALQKAYVDACSIDKWAPAAIHCHADHAAELPRFEKCRLLLPDDQRKHFDELVKAALDSAK